MISDPPTNSPRTYSCGMVGQSEYSLIPLRTSGSWSTSTVSYLAPSRSRIAIARLEKPHCGNSAVPFMKSTISLLFTMSAMRARDSGVDASLTGRLRVRHCGFELQCVKLSPYSAAEGGIDRLMLSNSAQSGETAAHDARCIMVAVTGKIADFDFSVGDGRLDQPLDLACGHRHQRFVASMIWRRA